MRSDRFHMNQTFWRRFRRGQANRVFFLTHNYCMVLFCSSQGEKDTSFKFSNFYFNRYIDIHNMCFLFLNEEYWGFITRQLSELYKMLLHIFSQRSVPNRML